MKFFGQGEIETRYDLGFRSYFATAGIDRLFSASPRGRVRAGYGGKPDRLAVVLKEGDYTKTGFWRKSIKLSFRAATARPAELLGFRRRHLEHLRRRSLDSQLIRLGMRLAGIAIAVGLLIQGAYELGFPAYSVLAGLGVGGLAVALASRVGPGSRAE